MKANWAKRKATAPAPVTVAGVRINRGTTLRSVRKTPAVLCGVRPNRVMVSGVRLR